MHRISTTVLICYAGYLLSACTSSDNPAQTINALPETAPGNFLTTRAWQCDVNGYLVTSRAKDSAGLWVFLPEETLLLPPASADADTHYLDGRVEISFAGLNADLKIAGQTDRCSENRPMSIREDAKLRGVDYWATGNEPPWRLEISPTTLILTTGYEQRTHRFNTPVPLTDEATKITRYDTRNDREHLTIAIEGRQCSDSMSGAAFSTRVTLQLEGTRLSGCGQALH
jgi:uncharacterized membrane protein